MENIYALRSGADVRAFVLDRVAGRRVFWLTSSASLDKLKNGG